MAGRPPGNQADGKQRLLDACWQLLVEAETGERLTIAQVCERAGCTPPTLYHHFGDLASLELEATRQAYIRWNAVVVKEILHIKDPKKRLSAHGVAYAAWAHEHPDAYAIMFCRPGNEGPSITGPGFSGLVASLAEIHGCDPDDPALLPAALTYWGLVHGLSTLQNSAQGLPEGVVADVLARFEDVMDALPLPEAPKWAEDVAEIRELEQKLSEPAPRRQRMAGVR